MKYLSIVILVFCFTSTAFAKGTTTTIQVIMDDSGVLIEPSEADKYKMHILSQLKKLTRKREFSHAQIDVISSSIGRTVWSGTPSDLKRKPVRALALVNAIKSVKENCNNLSGAFNELASNLRALKREGITTASIIIFSSLIDTPRPCDKTTTIELPQMPPVQGDINKALSSFEGTRSINFYWVSPHQTNVWEGYLDPTFNWASKNNTSISINDIERSKFSLRQGLKLEASK